MDSFSICFFWALFGAFALQLQGYGSLACMEEERTGLLKLKKAFKLRDDGFPLTSWGGEQKNCCMWDNVECDFISKRVSELFLDGTNNPSPIGRDEDFYLDLSSLLPFRELKKLNLARNFLRGFTGELRSSKLQYLDLSSNMLTEIPPFLSGQKSLKCLILESNHLTNLSNFEDLTTLSTLKALSFHGNELTGSLPEGLCMLRNLEELDLSVNNLTGVIPKCLSNLTSLKVLDFSKNHFIGDISSNFFQNLTSLGYISLSYNNFKGLISFSSFSSNSKLEFFALESQNNELEVDTENPPWTPLFQLKVLRLSNCRLNDPTSVIPTFLLNQHNLRVIDLNHNGMKGEVPSWLIRNNTNLEFLSLAGNSLTGRFLLHPHSENLRMFWLDISMNQIQKELPGFIGLVLPNLLTLNMSVNMFQGSIPSSIGDLKRLEFLDLSNNNFSGEIPQNLATGCESLRFLKLSNNNLHGPLLPKNSNLTNLVVVYLDNNHFSGKLPHALVNNIYLGSLDIGDNSISGEIPNWLGDLSELTSLVLSNNSFEGPIPPSFCNLTLYFLDLSHNRFSGFIPSCFNLALLSYLHLQGNDFVGPLPRILSQSTSLITLDVRDNNFSGEIPRWISSLSNLRVLLLKRNNLSGFIPSEICHLKNLSILDLSSNKFAGSIPSCLCQIPFGKRRLIDGTFKGIAIGWATHVVIYSYESELNVCQYLEVGFHMSGMEEEIEFMSKSRFESYERSILYYISGIDLSQNELSADIPNELGNLTSIHTLNLSHNHLNGSIPKTFAKLKEIESLDLSFNRLSGEIPSELTQLNFLSVFSVAYNNLSGSIPDRKSQFETFAENTYAGNPLLCGPPLQRSCTRSRKFPSPLINTTSGEKESFRYDFLLSFLISYLAAFLGVVSFLYLEAYYIEYLFGLVIAKLGIFRRT